MLCFLFLPSESYVKLLIRGENLAKEKEEAMEEMLTQVVEAYVKFNVFPRDNVAQALKAFTDHLYEAYGLLLVTLKKGSVIIILDCPRLEGLELLWSDYCSGHLDKVAKRYLVSDEIKKLKLETICLKTVIEEEDYLYCKNAIMKLLSTSSGEYKKSF